MSDHNVVSSADRLGERERDRERSECRRRKWMGGSLLAASAGILTGPGMYD